MRRALFAVIALVTACSDEDVAGPYDALPLDGDFTVGVSRPVHVARDRFGVAHISASNVADAAFVQGYVMAHDRLPQMDILRRFGAGTLSELFGALDPTVIDTDLEMRMHRMTYYAQQSWNTLQASPDPADQQIVQLLQRFADGVNAYAAAIQTDDNPGGAWVLDPNLLASFDPIRFTPWSPIDSLVLGRFQAFALSWTTPFELDVTELYQGLRTTYDTAPAGTPAFEARRGISADIVKFTPVGLVPTIDGFPNVGIDTDSRSDNGGRRAKPSQAPAPGQRPHVPQRLFDSARRFFARGIHTGPFGSLGPHAFMQPYAGSNNWAVGPGITKTDMAILATDQHLQLPNPSIFYPTHLMISGLDGALLVEEPLDVMGVTFPGIPGVILGTNGLVAWSGTVSEHDVNDVYLEQITPCPAGSCVTFSGQQVPIETFTETINVGALGTMTREPIIATYEVVPHHGPIIPEIDETNHRLIPRTDATAMSVRYTGYQPTFEIRALWNLGRAYDVRSGFSALTDFSYGSQNWMLVDNGLDIGWTTHAIVPERAPAAYAWNATTNPTGAAPFFVLPGDGSAEWTGEMSNRYIPHAINPAMGFLSSANADPVGATFDGDPLDQELVDNRPLYAGVAYAAGLRQERIVELLREPDSVTVEHMQAMQHDTKSTMGTKLGPYLVSALSRVDSPDGMPADFVTYAGTLSADDRARLTRALSLLASWTFATPTGLDGNVTDSAATAVFNAWMHFFIERTLRDELAAFNFDVWRLDDNAIARVIFALISAPQTFVQSASTLQPILCDDLATAGPDASCSTVLVQAMLAAMLHLESSAGFGTADVAQWQWGKMHRLTIEPLFPNSALDLPGGGMPGFAKSGDNFAVNRSDQGWDDLDFSQSADGPAQRFVAIAQPGQPIQVKWALPGGVIYDSRSSHYRDLLDEYYLKEAHFDAPFALAEIVAAGEHRWLFH